MYHLRASRPWELPALGSSFLPEDENTTAASRPPRGTIEVMVATRRSRNIRELLELCAQVLYDGDLLIHLLLPHIRHS